MSIQHQPIIVKTDTIFAIENDLLELQLEFVGAVERITAFESRMIPMFKLIECVVVQEATEKQVLRIKNQN